MRAIVLFCGMLMLEACSRNALPPNAYKHVGDQLKSLAGGTLGTPCSKTIATKGGNIEQGDAIEDCFKFDSPKRLSGIWLTEFEASYFLENAQQPPLVWRWGIDSAELTPAKTLPRRFASLAYAPPRSAFLVTFIGRHIRHLRVNRFGGTDDTVLMEKMLSIKPVAAPSKTEMCLPKCKSI